MILCFLDPLHVSLMLTGEKRQTTRKAGSVKIGDKLECVTETAREIKSIGDATITDVIKLRGGLVIERQRETTRESWAKRDGFASFEDADKFFSGVYGPDWQGLELDIIYFKGDWIRDVE